MNRKRFFARNPVFTTTDYHNVTGGVSRRAEQDQLRRAVERGDLLRIRNNLFAVVPPDVDADRFEPDRFQVLAALRADAVFCGHSALELLGSGYSVWRDCLAYSAGRREMFCYRSIRYRPIAPPTALDTLGLSQVGLQTHDRAGVFVKSLGPERVLVEGFRRPEQYGGLTEFLASIRALTDIDQDLLLRLLAAFDERRLYSAVGWFLETQGAAEGLLALLEPDGAKTVVYLDRKMGPTRKAARWNLLVPERLMCMEVVSVCRSSRAG